MRQSGYLRANNARKESLEIVDMPWDFGKIPETALRSRQIAQLKSENSSYLEQENLPMNETWVRQTLALSIYSSIDA